MGNRFIAHGLTNAQRLIVAWSSGLFNLVSGPLGVVPVSLDSFAPRVSLLSPALGGREKRDWERG